MAGRSVLVVEDTTTTGGVADDGGRRRCATSAPTVVGVATILDRATRRPGCIAAAGLTYRSLLTWTTSGWATGLLLTADRDGPGRPSGRAAGGGAGRGRTAPAAVADDEPAFDPELLADGDRRNVVDAYRYWRREAIVADLDLRRFPFEVAIENFGHDYNIGTVVRTANAFAAAAGAHRRAAALEPAGRDGDRPVPASAAPRRRRGSSPPTPGCAV